MRSSSQKVRSKVHHANNGKCEKCLEIINLYPSFNNDLLMWFQIFQAKYPEAHVSCAGRGKQMQEDVLNRGSSRAHWGESAHNYNCAIDIFINKSGLNIYDRAWFETILAPEIPDFLNWYGAPGAAFPELPHIEVKNWRDLKAQKLIELVEAVVYPGDYLND